MKCRDALMCVTLAFVVSLLLVILYLHKAVAEDIFFVAIPLLVLCAVVFFIYRQRRRRSELEVSGHRETDDVESGNGTLGDEENNNGDAPPVYESVVAKPPPYEYLYVRDPSSFAASVVAAPGNNDASAVLRLGGDGGCEEGGRRPSCTTLQEAQGYPDPDLPSYSDIVKPASTE